MLKKKYAVEFPDFQNFEGYNPITIFSEKGIKNVEDTLNYNYALCGSVTNLIIEKNKTRELEKQLDARKEALDAQIDNAIEQLRIEYVEYAKRLKMQVEKEKESMRLAFEQLRLEIRKRVDNLELDYEVILKESAILKTMICQEKDYLLSSQKFIDMTAGEYGNRKEYVLYCDSCRKSMELINKCLESMV